MAESGSEYETPLGKIQENISQEHDNPAEWRISLKKKSDESFQKRKCMLKCIKHDGQLIDVYCPDHNEVCCALCIKVSHGSCADIKALQEVAEQEEIGEEILELQTDLKDRQSHLFTLKNVGQLRLERLLEEKDAMQKQMRSLRQTVRTRLDTMENNTVDEAVERFQKKIQSRLSDIKEIDEVLAGLSNVQHDLTEAKHENNAEVFVCLKFAQEYQKKASQVEKKIEEGRKVLSQTFYPNPQVEKFLNENESLGQVSEVSDVTTASWYRDVNVSALDDDFQCEISDFCQATDGSIYVTDYINRRLKRLNNSFSVVDSLQLPSFPWSVCQINEEHLMVTLKQAMEVVIVSVAASLSIESSFTAGDKIRGIAHFDGLIYICCGGSKIYEEGVGRMEVHSIDGAILRAYFEHLSCPSDVKISKSGKQIYVSDAYFGLVVMDNDGHLLYKIELKEVDVLCGICKIGSNLSCVAGFKSNNIMLVDEVDKSYREILGITDGIIHPKGLHYEEKLSLLFVSMGSSDIIKLFKLK